MNSPAVFQGHMGLSSHVPFISGYKMPMFCGEDVPARNLP